MHKNDPNVRRESPPLVVAAMEQFSKSAHHKFSGLLFPGTVGSTLTEFSSGCVFPIPPEMKAGGV
jgi:hypothetical protein